jgi:5,10-methylene-tetrahydrofolate dehydrogenase/methenyl tetrahydrofolate cyclohydrolase
MIKRGATVIDFGFSIKKDKIVGDVDVKKVAKIAKHVSPVPGGMGPVTVAMLFSNLISMAKKQTSS